ncbi:hypothetical protein OBK03_10785 [Empedobacter falsenii]
MKTYLFLIILIFSNIVFSQNISKKEFKKIINNSMNDSYNDEIITDNRDSIFYKSENLKIYNNSLAKAKFQFCHTIAFRFLKKKRVSLIDCQTCNEPTFCHVTKEQNIFNYKLDVADGKLILKLKNKFSEMNFQIALKNKIEFENNKFDEIIIKRKF